MKLKGDENLSSASFDFITDIKIDLLPTRFYCLSSCKVGILSSHDDFLYSEAIELFDHVVVFERSENHVAYPRLVKGVQMKPCPKFTDLSCIVIGGSEHQEVNKFDFVKIHIDFIIHKTIMLETCLD